MNWRFWRRKVRPERPEIQPGQQWRLQAAQQGPWKRDDSYGLVIVRDVKDGWVRYRIGFTLPDERLRADVFRHCYVLEPN